MDANTLYGGKPSESGLAQTFQDAMFEPRSGFNFADTVDHPSLQLNTGSPQGFNTSPFFNLTGGIWCAHVRSIVSSVPGVDAFPNSFDADPSAPESTQQFPQCSDVFGRFADHIHACQNQNINPSVVGAEFPDANSLKQTEQNHTTAIQQFGQITPLYDAITELRPSTLPATEFAVTEAAEKVRTDKSERARNAAHQRHAKTRKMRINGRGSSPATKNAEEGEAGDKKERYRERNRSAAAKCRAKKKEDIGGIEVRYRNLSTMNSFLRSQVQDLRVELTGLRMHALDHHDCNCSVSKYNMNRAKTIVLGEEIPSRAMVLQESGVFMPYME